MNIFIRTDSSLQIGSGHVMRCLTLADILRESGCDVTFGCLSLPGNLIEYIKKKGFIVFEIPSREDILSESSDEKTESNRIKEFWHADFFESQSIIEKLGKKIDWLVVDHYSLDIRWESRMRAYVKRIMVIDDLANRCHDCDLLLDQNYYRNLEDRYRDLIPSGSLKLLGPQYVLLRQEFREARNILRDRDGSIRRIFIFFGGYDETNETQKALKACQLLNRPDITIDVVIGVNNPKKKEIQSLCSTLPNTFFHCQIENMAELMMMADLAIGAGGSTIWERCLMGLPTISVIVAEHQADTTNAVSELGAIWNLGWREDVQLEDFAEAIRTALGNSKITKQMEMKGKALMGTSMTDGHDRMLCAIMNEIL